MLQVMRAGPDYKEVQILRRYTLQLLKKAHSNKGEAERVITDMIVRADHDREEWIYGRAFRAWRDGGCQGPRPERTNDPEGKVQSTLRRPNGTMPWTNTPPRPPGSKRRSASPADPG